MHFNIKLSSSSSFPFCDHHCCGKNLAAPAMETGSNSQQKAVVKKKPKISCNVKKQQEKKNSLNRDIISNLPDTILHHIFSFLDIELAVKTCILSKRWRYLWTTLPHLNFFNDVHLYEKADTQKLDFFDRVFVLRDTTSNILSLDVHICSSSQVPPSLNIIKGHLTTWIFAAVKSSVQHLSIQILLDYRYDYLYGPKKRKRKLSSIIKEENPPLFKFPDCLFTSKTLMSLELKTNSYECRFNTCLAAAYSIISLPLLKTLHLAYLTLVEGCSNDNFITKIVSSCPVLESLIIKECEFHCCSSTSINISSLKLNHLEIEKCSMISNSAAAAAADPPVEIEFKLNAPNLISLSIKDCMLKDYTLENLASLLKANIDLNVRIAKDGGQRNNIPLELPEEMKRLYAPRMMKILKALHNVKDLKLSPWFIEVVSGAVDLLEIRPTQFCNLSILELRTWFSRDCIHSIAYLLQICPNIDTLSIEVTPKILLAFVDYDKIMLESLIRDYWEPGLSMKCMLYHLKVVKFQGYLDGDELKFLEFLLKNAPVLEKLTVTYNGYGSQKKRETEFADKLHAFPRASSRITIMFF